MGRYLLRRLPSALLVLLASSVAIFGLLRLVPGDPATTLAGADAPPEAVAAIRAELGLDRPLGTQYVTWLGDVLTGDLGRSYLIGGQIADLVRSGLVNTLVLTAAALLLAVAGSLVTSLLWARVERGPLDSLLTSVNTLALALPTFVTGVALVLVLGIVLRVLPTGGTPPAGFARDPDIAVQYLLMPAVCLALPASAALTRFLTEALRTELAAPYVTTARAAGVRSSRLLVAHALPAALPTYLTVLGLQAGGLLGGAVLVEAIFSWPGLGQLAAQAIDRRDYPVVQVLLLLSVAVFVVVQLTTDVVHAWLDPRVRIGGLT
ncbi:ABC transporter permease subunit [Auraticoccus sp. F435]|uniref:ABC transporter permease subunit n=1 Tax=Auraticoccus cholistanensis TaxID=2656650 RepID=A0A6A9V0M3_9ACTN|nr:ABC transporter permease [Auraticoccus cholistanensis]MVA75869.1 ABC transporter permease subunit [Auraticoccus cholistanensis]